MVSRTKAADERLVEIMDARFQKLRQNFLSLQERRHGRDYIVEPGTSFRDYAPRGAFITHEQLVEVGKLYKLRPTGVRLLTIIIEVYLEQKFDEQLIPALSFPEGNYQRGCIVLANVPGA